MPSLCVEKEKNSHCCNDLNTHLLSAVLAAISLRRRRFDRRFTHEKRGEEGTVLPPPKHFTASVK
jgi:hypothetical protein